MNVTFLNFNKITSPWFHKLRVATLDTSWLRSQRLCDTKLILYMNEGLKLLIPLVLCVKRSWSYSTVNYLKKQTSEVLCLKHSTLRCSNLDTSESRSEISGRFWNVVLEKVGEDPLDRLCEKRGNITYSQKGKNILNTTKEGKLNGLFTSCVGTSL